MTGNAFINSQMISGHRYAQRFTTITEGAYCQDGLDRELTEYAKTHIIVSLTPYVHEPNVNVIVGYLADLTEERIKNMCNDYLVTRAGREWREKKEARSKEELMKDPEFIQFKTWCEDLVYWEDKNGLVGKPIVLGGGNSMPPLLNELVEAKDKEKVELYKKLFPDFAKKITEAKEALKAKLAKQKESKTIVTGQSL